jgi:hypothetical protein
VHWGRGCSTSITIVHFIIYHVQFVLRVTKAKTYAIKNVTVNYVLPKWSNIASNKTIVLFAFESPDDQDI